MIICDDVRRTNITRNGPGLLQNLITIAAVGAAAWFGADWFKGRSDDPEITSPVVVDPVPTDNLPKTPAATGSLQLRRLSDFPGLFQRESVESER